MIEDRHGCTEIIEYGSSEPCTSSWSEETTITISYHECLISPYLVIKGNRFTSTSTFIVQSCTWFLNPTTLPGYSHSSLVAALFVFNIKLFLLVKLFFSLTVSGIMLARGNQFSIHFRCEYSSSAESVRHNHLLPLVPPGRDHAWRPDTLHSGNAGNSKEHCLCHTHWNWEDTTVDDGWEMPPDVEWEMPRDVEWGRPGVEWERPPVGEWGWDWAPWPCPFECPRESE